MLEKSTEKDKKKCCKKADGWTITGTVIESLTAFASYSYSIGKTIDSTIGLEPKFLGLSWYGLGIGLGVGSFFTVCSTIAHYTLNVQHQSTSHASSAENSPRGNYESINQSQLINQNSINLDINKLNKGELTFAQWFIYAGDLGAHTFDTASPFILICDIALSHKSIPRYAKILLDGGAIVLGAIGAKAHARTCKNGLVLNNKEERKPIFKNTFGFFLNPKNIPNHEEVFDEEDSILGNRQGYSSSVENSTNL